MTARRRLSLAGAAAGLIALGGCGTLGGGADNTTADAAYLLSTRLADAIGRCWFAGGETAFAGYIYSPERNADQSRILIVRKDDPIGLPALVIEARSGSSADVYGPLATSPDGPRIRRDVERWVRGGTACG